MIVIYIQGVRHRLCHSNVGDRGHQDEQKIVLHHGPKTYRYGIVTVFIFQLHFQKMAQFLIFRLKMNFFFSSSIKN